MTAALKLSDEIVYRIENNFDEICAATRYLWAAHWDEIASHKEVRHFDPDLELRRRLIGKNWLAMTARQGGRVIGYISWFVYGDPQVQDQITAETDIYYVEPRSDRALVMLQLMRRSLDELARRGVTIARPRTKLKTEGPGRGAGLLWERLGFKPFEIIYGKVLDKPDR